MRLYAQLLSVAAVLCLPGNAAAQVDKHPTWITVTSPLRPDTTLALARAAMVDAGWTIADANPRAITTESRAFKKGWDLYVVAYVDPIGDSTRFSFEGTYSVTCCGIRISNMRAEGGRSNGPGQMWKELQSVAGTVQRAVSMVPAAPSH